LDPQILSFGFSAAQITAKTALPEPRSHASHNDPDHRGGDQSNKQRHLNLGRRNIAATKRVEGDSHNMPICEREGQNQQGDRRNHQKLQQIAHIRSQFVAILDVRTLVRRLFIQSFAQFLAGFEEGHEFLADFDMLACPRIAAEPGVSLLDGKRPKAAQLDSVATRKRIRHFIENGVDDILDITKIEMWIAVGDTLNEFRFNH
jgi:hypothetical protein